MDLAATTLELGDVAIPDSYDARSLVPLFENADAPWPDDIMCEFHGHRFFYTQRMIRWADYKYVFNAPDIDEFYDLENDPNELVNRIDASRYQNRVKEGRQRLLKWMRDTGDPMLSGVDGMLSDNGNRD
jgi:arylsulfatase A-like enzyme